MNLQQTGVAKASRWVDSGPTCMGQHVGLRYNFSTKTWWSPHQRKYPDKGSRIGSGTSIWYEVVPPLPPHILWQHQVLPTFRSLCV